MRTQNEIQNMLASADQWKLSGKTQFPNDTYESGAADALAWALGQSEHKPIEKKYPATGAEVTPMHPRHYERIEA